MKPTTLLLFSFFTFFKLSAQSHLPSLLLQFKRDNNDTSKVNMLGDIASAYRNVRPDSARYYVKQQLQLATRINFVYGIAKSYRMLAELEMAQGEVAEAKKDFDIALALFTKEGKKLDIASAHNGLGGVALRRGEFTEAIRRFLLAQRLYQLSGNRNGIITAYNKLGAVYQQMGDLEKALTSFNKGLDMDKAFAPSDRTGRLMNNIGIVYFGRREYQIALDYYLAALKKMDKPEFSDIRILLLSNTGDAYEKIGDLAAAARYQKAALKLIRERNLKEYEIGILTSLASVTGKSKPDSGRLLLNQALQLSKELDQRYMMLDVYQGMINLYKQDENYKAAVETLELRNLLQDSLFTIKKAKDVADLQSSYDLSTSTVKVQKLELSNQQIRFNRNIVRAFAIFMGLILLAFIFFYIRTRKLNQQLMKREEALKQQQSELKKLNNFKDKLFSIIGHDLRAPITSIVSLMEVAEINHLSEEEFQSFVPKLKEQSNATLEILDKLLIWGKSQIKGTAYSKSAFNAKELITKNITLYKSAAAEKEISITDHTPQELMIYADMTQVDFIVRNLLANAIKYTYSGGKIELHAAIDQLHGYNTLFIKDNGVGIAGDLQQQIFERENLSLEGTASEKGNSIGLMLCKEFVEENGGKIQIESKLGEGTQFSVTLPSVKF